jgi:hypothetical protein
VKFIHHMCRADCWFGGLRECVCVRAVVEWPGFLSIVEVVFCIGMLGYVHALGCGRGFMAGGSLRGCQRLRWGIWYIRRLGDCCEFGVYVKSFSCVHVGSFLVILQHLHNVVYGAERMCFFI